MTNIHFKFEDATRPLGAVAPEGAKMIDQKAISERLSQVVVAGGAICLLGAGFAISGSDQDDQKVPSTQELINEIKIAVDVDTSEDVSLTDIADYCEGRPEHAQTLRRLLVKRLTLCRPSPIQRIVVNQPWRSIFTTNFDDTIESCLPELRRQIITPTSNADGRDAGKTPIYYMHGRAKDLVESSIDPRMVISERNYLRLHEGNRELYSQLQNEIFAANLIVIVGYSMRDLDVARVFIESGHAFSNKTILIADPKGSGIAISRLEKFGVVSPIGVEGLAEILRALKPQMTTASASFQFVDLLSSPAPASDIHPDDLVKLVLTGSFERTKYQRQLQNGPLAPELYSIRRATALALITHRPSGGLNRFIVSADLGNGKSVFLSQLSVELVANGYKVVQVSSRLTEVFGELDQLLKTASPTAFLIDDVIRFRAIAEYIAKRITSLSIIVCCLRGDPGEVAYQDLSNRLGGSVKQIDINRLSASEIKEWDVALERWGLWEQRIALKPEDRQSFLSKDCGGENRSIVLALFRSSQIATKIDQIVRFFLKGGSHKRAFAALLTSSLCQQHLSWESLVFWLGIDEQRLREDIKRSDLANLFFDGRNWNIFTSTQLAEYILRTKYVQEDKDTLVEVFSTVVQKTAESASDKRLGEAFNENLKELMKFRFLTRLFGGDDSAAKLISQVYTKLSNARYIRSNPQFWLQYAMSRMEIQDLENAETYLNTAYGLAIERGRGYSPYQIIDQRARLLFRKNTPADYSFSRDEIKLALSYLNSLLNNPESEIIYLFRSAPLIGDFVEAHIDEIDAELRGELLDLLKKIELAGQGWSNLPRSQKGETKVLQKALSDALLTLRFG